ncbi:hypothetical protein GPJ56_008883 [Histomonas meleagridis]|uniref:uncharacterized protein n=1 Tax=Histomonas meleagridis TaxID=135588 RepID=UPI00355A3FF3|nr:hypothetical protein GPJ56_008883 [Histomonas meleagridis]KAH0797809.1 hypothetical protein GO595_009438 [Histomonas meleagridis]
MKNTSNNSFRFEWGNHHNLTFSPKIGHLHSNQSKEIVLTFFTEKPIKINSLKIPLQCTKIEFIDPNPPDWDDTCKQRVFKDIIKEENKENENQVEQPIIETPKKQIKPKQNNTTRRSSLKQNESRKLTRRQNESNSSISKQFERRSSLKSNLSSSLPKPAENLNNNNSLTQANNNNNSISKQNEPNAQVSSYEIAPEPNYRIINAKPKDIFLYVNAISDLIRYQIDTREITFSPTMMYQSRVYDVKLTNTSQIRLDYKWIFESFTSTNNNENPFSITPNCGSINSGQTLTFKVRFSPIEADDFSATYKCQIPFLSVMKPPLLNLSGISKRPLCHFNVQMSDYLTANRRSPLYKDKLPDNVQVFEIISKRINEKVLKNFDIINPTAIPYEVDWNQVTKDKNCPIKCLVPHALISSGKKYNFAFSFCPNSMKTVETLWVFTIKEHDIRINFLIVGRILPE